MERYEYLKSGTRSQQLMAAADIDFLDYDGMDDYFDYFENENKYEEEAEKRRDECTTDRCKNAKTKDDNRTNSFKTERSNTTATTGYGTPSKGKYYFNGTTNYSNGYKTFGTMGQGNSTYGVRELNSSRCQDRYMMVTVTATEDLDDSSSMTV